MNKKMENPNDFTYEKIQAPKTNLLNYIYES